MKAITLELFGQKFVERFIFYENFRIFKEMRNDACWIYIQEGTLEVYSPSKKITVNSMESILMKCGNYIANFKNAIQTSQFKSIVFHLYPESIKKAFGDSENSFLKVKKSSAINPALKIKKNDLLDSFVSSIIPYFENQSLVSERLLATKLQELVLILSDEGKNTIATHILGTLHSEEQLKFNLIIKANLYNNLSVAELAHLTYRSESTFKRDFKKYFDISPAKYFKTKKMEKAANLLMQTDMPIRKIASKCGFENADHFSTSFTSAYRKSPRTFRSENR
ncbi:MAG: helix-turn-helix transcriptional regulator [Bacteroidetes bacterium]|nr:helix-turn-helix transcriptional regulator [Bacteroidota bacterium]